MPHKVEKLLLDIVLACDETTEFCRDKTLENFSQDRLLQSAVERQFEIMGEALYRLERIDLENLHVKIPDYRKVIGLSNILAHGYDIVDNAALWDFVVTKVPDLKKKAEAY